MAWLWVFKTPGQKLLIKNNPSLWPPGPLQVLVLIARVGVQVPSTAPAKLRKMPAKQGFSEFLFYVWFSRKWGPEPPVLTQF